LRKKLVAHRFDLIAQIDELLLDASKSLLAKGDTAVDTLETFEHLAANLLQPNHIDRQVRVACRAPNPESRIPTCDYFTPVVKTVRER
jgi:hypothetical protein